MSRKYKSLGTGYLYKLYEGELQEYSGEVVIDERYADMLSNVTRGRAYFKVGGSQDRSAKTFTCSDIEKEVYNGMVWLHESDKRRATQILLFNEIDRVESLKKDVRRHEKTIDVLRKCISETYGFDK
jgi:hypothetical protein